MKVMIVVTHLLGTGHLARALVLSRAFRANGHDVTLVSGGMPAPHLHSDEPDPHALPPLRSDGVNFTRLFTPDDSLADEDYLAKRRAVLLSLVEQHKPEVLVTELFPFGRRVLKAEFLALLEHVHAQRPRPLVCASIRDILAPPSKPAKADETDRVVGHYYDAVLVHSDPQVVPLELSWPVSAALSAKLHYTGFVASPLATAHPDTPGAGEVLVSAGGGDVGQRLYSTALSAAALDPAHVWRLLVGGAAASDRIRALQDDAPANAIVEPARTDFRQMLPQVRASISLCGYNTALDLLQTHTPAVFVPFDDGGEVEQRLRAEALARMDGCTVLPQDRMTPQRLLAAVVDVVSAPSRPLRRTGMDGAGEAVRIVEKLRRERVQ